MTAHLRRRMWVLTHQDALIPQCLAIGTATASTALATRMTIPAQLFLLVSAAASMYPARGVLIPDGNFAVVAIIVLKSVGFFAVDGEIADFETGVVHAEGDAADVFDEDHDQACPDYVPADDEAGACDLDADLAAVAGDGATGVGDAEGGAALFGGPESCF